MQKEEEFKLWMPVTVALTLTEITISLCSNIDVKTRPVQKVALHGLCLLPFLKKYIVT